MARARVFREAGQSGGAVAEPGLEERIAAARRWLEENPSASKCAAATKFKIQASTFLRRINGVTKSRSYAREAQRLLTADQELVLIDWLKHWGEEGRGVGRRALRVKVEKLCGRKPSFRWVDRFRARHPEDLGFKTPKKLAPERARCFNPTVVSEHFRELKEIMEQYQYKPSNIYNMDEKGCQMGGGREKSGRKVFFGREDNACYQIRSDDLELVTMLECVSADGASLAPTFIFAGGTYDLAWFNQEDVPFGRKVTVGTSENGWTNDKHCLKWFEESFVPQARARAGSPDEPILLIFDGHGSHVTKDMRDLADKYDIHLYCLPPHTTHKLQPLDVGVFGPLTTQWIDRCTEIAEERGDVHRGDFVIEYLKVRQQSITEAIIKAAWANTGIVPLNPNIFTKADFAPSRPTSTKASFPSSFPTAVLDTTSGTPSNQQAQEYDEPIEEGSDSEDEDDLEGEDSNDEMDLTGDPSSTEPAPCNGGLAGTGPGTDNMRGVETAETSGGYRESGADGPVLNPEHSSCSTTESESPLPMQRNLPSEMSPPLFTPSPTCSNWSLANQLQVLRADFDALLEAYAKERSLRIAAQSHCTLAKGDIQLLKSRLNAKDKTSARQTFRSKENFLTGEKAQAAFKEYERAQQEKAKQEELKGQRKKEKEREIERRRAELARLGDRVEFTGSLQSKNRDDLDEVLFILGLTMPAKSTKADVLVRLNSHFDAQPELRTDPRFIKIFSRPSRSTRGAAAAPPAAPAPALNDTTGAPSLVAPRPSTSNPTSSSNTSTTALLAAPFPPPLSPIPHPSPHHSAAHSFS
ncbi:DDE-domain-containing protein [Trametes sanguinea]|nr:DDE-domain-containing protein [Trametes sanguinea]